MLAFLYMNVKTKVCLAQKSGFPLLKVHNIGISMNGIAKLLDFSIGRVKNQNTISTCEFFTVFVLDFVSFRSEDFGVAA